MIRQQRSAHAHRVPYRGFRSAVPRKSHHLLTQNLLEVKVKLGRLERERREIPEEDEDVPAAEGVTGSRVVGQVNRRRRHGGDHAAVHRRPEPLRRRAGQHVDGAGSADVGEEGGVLVLRGEGWAGRVELQGGVGHVRGEGGELFLHCGRVVWPGPGRDGRVKGQQVQLLGCRRCTWQTRNLVIVYCVTIQ